MGCRRRPRRIAGSSFNDYLCAQCRPERNHCRQRRQGHADGRQTSYVVLAMRLRTCQFDSPQLHQEVVESRGDFRLPTISGHCRGLASAASVCDAFWTVIVRFGANNRAKSLGAKFRFPECRWMLKRGNAKSAMPGASTNSLSTGSLAVSRARHRRDCECPTEDALPAKQRQEATRQSLRAQRSKSRGHITRPLGCSSLRSSQ